MQTKSGKLLFPIGIGTWNVSSIYNFNPAAKYNGAEPGYGNEDIEVAALQYSLSKGQNHIDCAELYGGFYTDETVGRAIVGRDRSDLYIADKLWKSSVATGKARETVEKMLKKLGTDYLDMLYIHAPFDDAPWEEAIPQIDSLIDAGLVRHFGVSNFTIQQMEQARQIAQHPLTANQMNYNVLHKNEVNQEFRDYCAEHQIQIVSYQPVKRQEVSTNDVLQNIGSTHNATAAQVALAWLIVMGTLPIPKAIQYSHIDENVASVDLELSADEMLQLSSL